MNYISSTTSVYCHLYQTIHLITVHHDATTLYRIAALRPIPLIKNTDRLFVFDALRRVA